MGFNFPEFITPGSYGTSKLTEYMTGQNYDFNIHDQWGWDKDTLANAMVEPTVWYVNSHGAQGSHYTGEASDPNAISFYADVVHDPDLLGYSNYERLRPFSNDPGYPPFNETHKPPVEFAQMDSCESGGSWSGAPPGDNSFSSLLHPFYNMWWPGITCPDQAVLTWKAFASADTTENAVYLLWTQLKLGKTVFQARKWLVDHNGAGGTYPVHIYWEQHPPHPWDWQLVTASDQLPVWGDPHTRVKGVYTGGPTLPKSRWYDPPLVGTNPPGPILTKKLWEDVR